MIVDLNRVAKPSKIQSQIFSILKKMQTKQDDYLVVLDKNNKPMGAIVSPAILEKYFEGEREKESAAKDDLKNFYHLSEKSFDFWDNAEDDVYARYYQ